jgi:hypothetical protein
MDPRFRQCTFFLLRKKRKGGGKEHSSPCGTCFAVGMELDGTVPEDVRGKHSELAYAVTARHVVENTRESDDLYIRVNTRDGSPPYDIPAPTASWRVHPTTDVAVCPIDWPEGQTLDVMVIPFANLPKDKAAIDANRITEGEEIMIVGLLTLFPGLKRIQPIFRSGRIALMPHEKIPVQVNSQTTEEVDAYLIEAMTWPGLSGSPVIIYPGRIPSNPRSFDHMLPYLVLGVLHGPVEREKNEKVGREDLTVRLGSGIAIAIPGEAVYDLLMNDPTLKVQRLELLEQKRQG